MSPTVLLTMSQLVAIETMIKNVSATARHLAGMQAAMKQSNKAVASQSNRPVQSAVEVWTQYFMHRAMVKGQIPRQDPLSYPKHPYDPGLSMKISGLPQGFCDIALSGKLSVQVLGLMDRFNDYFNNMKAFHEAGILDSDERTNVILSQAAWCIEFHQAQRMTLLERLLVTALTAYVVRRDRIHTALVNMRNYYQITCAYLLSQLKKEGGVGLLDQRQYSDMIIWAGLLLLLTSIPEAHARKLALHLLPSQPQPLKLHQKCLQFFWDEDLTNALLSGSVLGTALSNDIVTENVRQALPDAQKEEAED